MSTRIPAEDATSLEELDVVHKRMDELERKFHEAFPGGDYTGHCRYHDIQIEMLLARRQLIAAVQEKTISGIVWAFFVVAGLAVWQWLKTQVKL